MSCRDCLLVKVDLPSGGDIDGCLKQDIIDEYKAKLETHFNSLNLCKPKALMVLNYEEAHLDEKHCVECDLNQRKVTTAEELHEENLRFIAARERAYKSYKQWLLDQMRAAEKQTMSYLRNRYPVEKKPHTVIQGEIKPLTSFTEAT